MNGQLHIIMNILAVVQIVVLVFGIHDSYPAGIVPARTGYFNTYITPLYVLMLVFPILWLVYFR